MEINFIEVLIWLIVLGLSDLSVTWLKNREAKKCKYDCEKCRNWDCYKLYCDKKRSELNDKERF